MRKNNQYTTMVEAINNLVKKGYTHNFSVSDKGRLEEGNSLLFYSYEVELHEFHRFEGNTNPSDMSIIYAVQTKTGLRGIVIDSFGVQGSETISDFMNKVVQKQFDN
ncbi:MAG: hypothetical protein R2757_04575 [Draconibacterium sp.]